MKQYFYIYLILVVGRSEDLNIGQIYAETQKVHDHDCNIALSCWEFSVVVQIWLRRL